MTKPVCVIVGVGPGNGAAFARKFAANGFQVALLSRNMEYLNTLAKQIRDAKAYRCDVTDTNQIKAVFSTIKTEMGTVEILIYNAGSGIFVNIDDTTIEDFESSWRTNTLGLLVATQQVLPDMRHNGKGTIIVTGATASLRGNVHTAPFAPAKAAQRSLTQSIAKHAGPDGIHTAYVILDGIVGTSSDNEHGSSLPEHEKLQPDDIADTYFHLSQQNKSAWTFELDLRPYIEKW